MPVFLKCQVIPKNWGYLISPSGDTVEVKIVKEYADAIEYTIMGDSTQKVKTTLKTNGAITYRPVWQIPFNIDPETKKVTYSEVVPAPGMKADKLYNAMRLWFADYFRDSKSVLELDDKEAGILVGTGNSLIASGRLWITIKIMIKDERMKYSLSNIYVESEYSKVYFENEKMDGKWYRPLKTTVLQTLQRYCTDIKDAVKKASSNLNTEW